jgi:hypothetical protein
MKYLFFMLVFISHFTLALCPPERPEPVRITLTQQHTLKDSWLMFGETANQGMQKFIAGQTNFFAKFTEEERTLKRLGFTVDEITDTFLTYDKVSNYARVRTDRTDHQRNRAAVEFSLELDRLSKLTGKQREALKEQMIEVGRAGDVQARTNQLTTDAGKDSLTRSITNAKQFGPMVGKLAQDILTAGIPKGASRQVAGLAGEFTSSLYELRDAQMRGNAEEIKIAEQRVEQQAALLRENKTIQQLAIYSGLNAYTDISAGILESTAEGPARAYEIAKQQLIKEGKVVLKKAIDFKIRIYTCTH